MNKNKYNICDMSKVCIVCVALFSVLCQPFIQVEARTAIDRDEIVKIKESNEFNNLKKNGVDYSFKLTDQDDLIELWVQPRELERDHPNLSEIAPERDIKDYLVDENDINHTELYHYISEELPDNIRMNVYLTLSYDLKTKTEPAKIGPIYSYKAGEMIDNQYQVFVDEKYPEDALIREINNEAAKNKNSEYQYQLEYDKDDRRFVLKVQPLKLPNLLKSSDEFDHIKYFAKYNELNYDELANKVAQKVNNKFMGTRDLEYSFVNTFDQNQIKWPQRMYSSGKIKEDYKERYQIEWNRHYHLVIEPGEIVQLARNDKQLHRLFEQEGLKWVLKNKGNKYQLFIEPSENLSEILENKLKMGEYLVSNNGLDYSNVYKKLVDYLKENYQDVIDLEISVAHISDKIENPVQLYIYQDHTLVANPAKELQTNYHLAELTERYNQKLAQMNSGYWIELKLEENQLNVLIEDQIPNRIENFETKDLLAYERYMIENNYLEDLQPLLSDLSKETFSKIRKDMELNVNLVVPQRYIDLVKDTPIAIYSFVNGELQSSQVAEINRRFENRVAIVMEKLNGSLHKLKSIISTYFVGKEWPEFKVDEQNKQIYLVVKHHLMLREDDFLQMISDIAEIGLKISPETFYRDSIQIINDTLKGEYQFIY